MSDETTLEVAPHVLDYLGEHQKLTLATSSPTGVPRATTLTYANDGVALYVWTRPSTRAAQHIEQNPIVSFAIDDYAPDWRETKGVQGGGEAQVLLNPEDIDHVVDLFQRKFPSLEPASKANLSFFRITPTELEFIDNAAAGEEDEEQALGLEYHRELVYSVFRELPPREVATIAAKMRTTQVDEGAVIVRQGAPADKFFIIVDGEVEVLREDKGETRTLGTMTAGQFFGEMAILREAPRTATVRALTPTTLLTMERDDFRGLVAQSLETTQDFDRLIQERLYRLVAES